MGNNDTGCCGGICGVFVGIAALVVLLGALASALPTILTIIGILLVIAGVYYLFKKNAQAKKQNGPLPNRPQQGQVPQQPQRPPSPTVQDIQVTISDVEASDKTEQLKAFLEEGKD